MRHESRRKPVTDINSPEPATDAQYARIGCRLKHSDRQVSIIHRLRLRCADRFYEPIRDRSALRARRLRSVGSGFDDGEPTTASMVAPAVVAALSALFNLHTTLRGKHVVWRCKLDGLALDGDEYVLDVGCGRGAVLIAGAQRLPDGMAEGIDSWRSVDQSDNDPARTLANASAFGVEDRIYLHTGDMTQLPFPEASFELVTSALAAHNIPTADERRQEVAEMAQVLKPGGRLVLIDIKYTDE